MKRNFIIGLIAVLAVATIVYAQTVNRQIYGVATPGLYKYTLSTNTQDAYLLSVPTLSVADTIVGLAATQTLTNKTLTSPVIGNLTASKPVFTDSSSVLTSSGTMPVNQGGTGLTSYAVGDIPYASASTTVAKLAAVSAGSYLRANGTTAAPVYSTIKIPNTCTAGDIWAATGTNTMSPLGGGAAGKFLRGAGTTTVPAWSTLVLPNAATIGDILQATSSNTYASLAGVAAGQPLLSGGIGVISAYAGYTFSGTGAATYTFPGATATLARTDAGQTFTGVNVFTAPTFTTSITPTSAGASTIGTTALEWGHIYLTDSAVIYAQANQGNTLTSASTGWTANLEFSAPTLKATATGSLTLGASGVAGQTIFNGGTSGTITLTPTATAGTTVLTLPATTGTLAKLENTLGDFASTTSAQLYGKISDETGSASGTPLLVFNQAPTIASPVITTPITTKAMVDGSAALGLSAAQVSDTVITNTGQIVGDVSHTLPVAAAGYSFVGLVGQTLAATNYWRFTANTGPTPDDYVCLNGACGKLYASVDTPTMGDKITCHTAKIASTGIKTGGALAMGSTKDKVANGAFEFDIVGQGYAETADAVGKELNAITTPQNKYGCQALDIGADGTIDPISCTNIATGFDTPGGAVADLPVVEAAHTRIGYVTAMRTDIAGFVWGTTNFDDANTTKAFTSSTAYTPPYGWICTSDQGTWSTN